MSVKPCQSILKPEIESNADDVIETHWHRLKFLIYLDLNLIENIWDNVQNITLFYGFWIFKSQNLTYCAFKPLSKLIKSDKSLKFVFKWHTQLFTVLWGKKCEFFSLHCIPTLIVALWYTWCICSHQPQASSAFIIT